MTATTRDTEIEALEAEIRRLREEVEARPGDAELQARLSGKLSDIDRARAEELARIEELYQSSLKELEYHRKRTAVTVHDLKAPITIALLNLELIEMSDDAEEVTFYRSGMRRELEFMLDTIGNLLELQRLAEGPGDISKEPLNVHELLDGVIGRMQVLIKDRPQLELINAVPADFPELMGQRHHLTRVFNNLFSNSIKYTDQGHIKASATVNHSGGGERLRVVIEDTGQGIEKQRIPTLFAYYQGDTDRPESTGIGLAFVKQVMDVHAGRVWIESERGKGTRVVLEFPRG